MVGCIVRFETEKELKKYCQGSKINYFGADFMDCHNHDVFGRNRKMKTGNSVVDTLIDDLDKCIDVFYRLKDNTVTLDDNCEFVKVSPNVPEEELDNIISTCTNVLSKINDVPKEYRAGISLACDIIKRITVNIVKNRKMSDDSMVIWFRDSDTPKLNNEYTDLNLVLGVRKQEKDNEADKLISDIKAKNKIIKEMGEELKTKSDPLKALKLASEIVEAGKLFYDISNHEYDEKQLKEIEKEADVFAVASKVLETGNLFGLPEIKSAGPVITPEVKADNTDSKKQEPVKAEAAKEPEVKKPEIVKEEPKAEPVEKPKEKAKESVEVLAESPKDVTPTVAANNIDTGFNINNFVKNGDNQQPQQQPKKSVFPHEICGLTEEQFLAEVGAHFKVTQELGSYPLYDLLHNRVLENKLAEFNSKQKLKDVLLTQEDINKYIKDPKLLQKYTVCFTTPCKDDRHIILVLFNPIIHNGENGSRYYPLEIKRFKLNNKFK